MINKIVEVVGKILKGISCRSTCCVESSCNKGQKDEIIDEIVEITKDIFDVVKITYI